MGDFLEQYGAGDERRGKIIKRVAVSLAALLVVTGLLFYFFHTFRQERAAKRFFELLAAHDYKQAYTLWGCADTDANPCRASYPMNAFLQDWGPPVVSVGRFEVLDGESCGSGVIVDVDAGAAGHKKLWVERDSLVIGFTPPWPNGECPQRNRIYDFVRNLKYRLHGRTYQ